MTTPRAARTLAFLGLGLLSAGVFAQGRPSPLQNAFVGASIGTYLPSSGEVRELFGTSPVSYGVTLVRPYREARKGLRFDVDSLGLNNDGNRFFLIGATVGYEYQAVRQGDRPTGFARIGVGPAYYDYSVSQNGNDDNGRRIGILGAAEVGYTLSRNFVVSARYLATQEVGGLNFSGVELKLTIAAFKL